jgi:putative ABC transport system permease protein
MEEVAAESSAARRSTMVLLGAFAFVALALSAAGVYGVMAHLVAMRRGEIAIRMTLGATPRTVLSETIREGLVVALAGLAAGFAGSFALAGVLRTLAFGVQPLDPLTYATVALVLVMATVLACWIPARRAMRVNPAGVIRGA